MDTEAGFLYWICDEQGMPKLVMFSGKVDAKPGRTV